MDTSEIRFLGEMQRLEIRPGDKFVMRVDQRLSMDQQEILRGHWRKFAGDEVPLLILDRGVEIGVLGVGEAA